MRCSCCGRITKDEVPNLELWETLALCLYCGSTVTQANVVPDLDDNQGWSALATEHKPGCEWVATRAHRQEQSLPCA